MQQHGTKYFARKPPQPQSWGQKVKFNFSEHGQRSKQFFRESSHVAYQIRREWSIEHRASTYFVLTHTFDPWGGLKGQNIFFL